MAGFINQKAFIRKPIMIDLPQIEQQIQRVTNFQELVSTPFNAGINAIGLIRNLMGDFAEIVSKVELNKNITVIDEELLRELTLSEQGNLAREIILNDLQLLTAHGAAPVLNVIKSYERDEDYPFFPTDVYSFHIDRSTVPTDTILCTYYGAPTEIVPNSAVVQKIMVPEIRDELKKLYGNDDEGFDDFLTENFFDLHYQTKPNALPFSLGIGHIWRLAIDYPESKILPCIHRAPKEKTKRLLLIC